MRNLIFVFLLSSSLASVAVPVFELMHDSTLSVRQKIKKIQEDIDLYNDKEEVLLNYFKVMSSWHAPSAMDFGDSRSELTNQYPITKALLRYEEASSLFIEGVFQADNQELNALCFAAIRSQKRHHGIDATEQLQAKLRSTENERVINQIDSLVEELSRTRVIPVELRMSLENQPPTIEEILLARKAEREKTNPKSPDTHRNLAPQEQGFARTGLADDFESNKTSSNQSFTRGWIYWILGLMILGGFAKFVLNGRKS